MEDVWVSMKILKTIFQHLFTRENLLALLLCLMALMIVIMTAATSPQWIYQGF